VQKTLETEPPYGATVRFESDKAATGWNAPALSPWLERSLNRASQAAFGAPAAFMGEGGSIPFMAMLGEKFPGAQFVVTGVLGLLWIPLWNLAARLVSTAPAAKLESGAELLRDSRLWTFVAANALSMVGYSLWTNWTTLYLVEVHRLTLVEAAWYAWIPPLFAMFGGLGGGWLSLRMVDRGVPAIPARFRVCLGASVLALATAAIPLAPGPGWAAAGISLSIFSVSGFSVNMYTLPLDAFGGARAAFAVSILVASYGAVQAILSPAFGRAIDLWGYTPLAFVAAITPLAASAVLWGTGSVK